MKVIMHLIQILLCLANDMIYKNLDISIDHQHIKIAQGIDPLFIMIITMHKPRFHLINQELMFEFEEEIMIYK